jgi:hypothetical protein
MDLVGYSDRNDLVESFPILTHRNDGHRHTPVIMPRTGGRRIQGRHAVNEKTIQMMPVAQWKLQVPAAVHASNHRQAPPIREITHDFDAVRLGRFAIKVYRLNRLMGRILSSNRPAMCRFHKIVLTRSAGCFQRAGGADLSGFRGSPSSCLRMPRKILR